MTTPKVFNLEAADREANDSERPEPFVADLGPEKRPEDPENPKNVVVTFIDPQELSWVIAQQINPDAPTTIFSKLLSTEDYRRLVNQDLKQRQVRALLKGFAEHYGYVDLGNLVG